MDIEWAKDGITQEIFIIQARPETVHSQKNPLLVKEYQLLSKGDVLAKGNAVGSSVATGIARVLQSPEDANQLQPGEILVTDLTSPDWDPILKNAGAIITNKGGRTSHASIVARELGVPAIVGCGNATQQITDGEMITVSCCDGETGFVYKGKLNFKETSLDFSNVKIEYGNFYELNNIIETNIDIIHIDIANNGDVFEYAIKNYLPKLCENGILLLEGGSIERDKVEWMSKYNKPLIEPVIQKHIKNNLNIQVIGSFPSITIIRK